MACILRAPSANSSGVLVITTPERDLQIKKSGELRSKLESIKNTWLIGLHHNWHDHQFKMDPIFDFSMAGEGDLREVNGSHFHLLPMDACNFVPQAFQPSHGEKFWDILYVARAVYFKRIPEFFDCIRRLYDQGHRYRVLFICPIPPYDPNDEKTVFYKIRETYDSLFTEDEKNLFTLLTIDYRYPFPFDLESLAFFYRSSKIFIHTADDERRCRVAAYAWASGLPVVGMECVSGLLSSENRRKPYFYEVRKYADFPSKIKAALNDFSSMNWDQTEMDKHFNEIQSINHLDQLISSIAKTKNMPYLSGGLAGKNLSIRLGRHHNGNHGPNSLKTSLSDLIQQISLQPIDCQIINSADPEIELQLIKNKFSIKSFIKEKFS